MDAQRPCVVCHAPIPPRSGRGRRRITCSEACAHKRALRMWRAWHRAHPKPDPPAVGLTVADDDDDGYYDPDTGNFLWDVTIDE